MRWRSGATSRCQKSPTKEPYDTEKIPMVLKRDILTLRHKQDLALGLLLEQRAAKNVALKSTTNRQVRS